MTSSPACWSISGSIGVQNTVGSGNDLLQSIENLIGSTHDDWLIGNGGDNQLHGGLGADQMFGGEGADILLGENGNDNLFGGDGNDLLCGGSGIDWASYLFQSSGVWINLTTENSQNTSGAGRDTLISIENVAGSNLRRPADRQRRRQPARRLGRQRRDHCRQRHRRAVRHDGNDSLNGGLGNDVLEGGSGVDWALYNTGLGSGITIDLFSETQVAGGGGVDTLRDIENVMATGYADCSPATTSPMSCAAKAAMMRSGATAVTTSSMAGSATMRSPAAPVPTP